MGSDDDKDDRGGDCDSNPLLLEDSIRHLATLALNLSAQDWHDLGKQQSQQPRTTNGKCCENNNLAVADNLDEATERIVALLLVRIVAVLLAVQQHQAQLDLARQKDDDAQDDDPDQNSDGDDKDKVMKKEIIVHSPVNKYPSDYSTTTLCQAVLHPTEEGDSDSDCVRWPIAQEQLKREGSDQGDNNNNSSNDDGIGVSSSKDATAAAASTAAPFITISVLNQLRQFVRCMLLGYNNDLPFHNFHHCYHVVLSANKLLDLMLHVSSSSSSSHRHDPNDKTKRRKNKSRNGKNNKNKTYGLRSNPTALLALIFAALIHDVGHSGVNNRQRVAELGDDLALRYNDQSIHENYSLHLAFMELIKPEYAELRQCMFPGNDGLAYRAFRKLVIHVVLATDLTSPERLQLSSSMFQEAYPDYFDDDMDDEDGVDNINNGDEYNFADGLDHDNVDMDDDPRFYYDDEAGGVGGGAGGYDAHRRSSLRSMGSMPRAVVGTAYHIESSRRGSTNSVASDITMDSYTRQAKCRHVEKLNQKKNNTNKKLAYGYHARGAGHDGDDVDSRRYSLTSTGDHSERSEGDSMLLHARYVPKTQPMLSIQQQPQLLRQDSDSLGGSGTGEGGDNDVKLPIKGRANSIGGVVALDESVKSLNSSNLESIAADSMALTQQRKEGKSATRHKKGLSPARLTRRRRRASTGDHHLKNGVNVDDDDDDDGSLSLTPPSSEDELDGFVVTGITLSKSADHVEIKSPAKSTGRHSDTAKDIEQARGLLRRTKSTDDDELLIASMRSQQQQQKHGVTATPTSAAGVARSPSRPISTRRASTGNYNPSRFGRPISGQKIIEEGPADLNDSGRNMDWSPPASLAAHNNNDDAPAANLLPPPGYFRKHLGIRRSMDFSGEALEQYSKSSCGASSVFSEAMDATTVTGGGEGDDDDLDDEPNELRMTVVIEVFLKVADVSHWFQDWQVMVRFNSWLFRELCVAHAAGRGFDPRPSWFDNQIKAMEQYVLPLADQFCHLGVLTPEIGASFPTAVERNRSQWMDEGYEITQSLGGSSVDQKDEDVAIVKEKNENESA